jgi:hypothetical protein
MHFINQKWKRKGTETVPFLLSAYAEGDGLWLLTPLATVYGVGRRG